MFSPLWRAVILALLLSFVSLSVAFGAVEILDASYRPDRVLPEHTMFWKDQLRWGDDVTPYIFKASGALAVYLRNTGGSPVTVTDLTIDGASMTASRVCGSSQYKNAYPCGYKTNATLVAIGNPAWWHVDQNPIPPGGTAEVFVRIRTRVVRTLSLVVLTSAGNLPCSVAVDNNDRPRIAGYGISSDYGTLHLYLRHPQSGKAPTQILIDGVDKTSSCTMSGDSDYDLTPVRCVLGTTWTRGSYHVFQAVYDDGSKATDGLRVISDDFRYGRWGGPPSSDLNDALFHIRDMGIHSMNLQVQGWGKLGYTSDPGFEAIRQEYDILQVNNGGGSLDYGLFLADEPDATEDIQQTEMQKWASAAIGALSQSYSDQTQSEHSVNPGYPTMLNLDASFKPSNYYIYAHVPDVISLDPYYQARQEDSYWSRPNLLATYSKATYIYAFASTCQAAKEPGPVHMTIYSCRKNNNTRVFRWATPEEKRIEVFYCLGAGAKQISYWWFSNTGLLTNGGDGIGDANEPGSAALWREIGLLGAEIGVASRLLENSAPVNVKVDKPGKLWLKTLMSGTDSLVMICANDDYSCDDMGIMIRGLRNVEVSVEKPSWFSNVHVFEVDYKGVHDVPFDMAGSKINIHAGRVDVSRMIIVTRDSTLKSQLQARYTNTYGPRVTQLAPM